MQRYVVLLKFTDSGIREIGDSPKRAESFREIVESSGGKVESLLWTLGEFDGLVQFQAPDDQTAVALVLNLHKNEKVHTRMMRAFDSSEFAEILAKTT